MIEMMSPALWNVLYCVQFDDAYQQYAQCTPRFFPHMGRPVIQTPIVKQLNKMLGGIYAH